MRTKRHGAKVNRGETTHRVNGIRGETIRYLYYRLFITAILYLFNLNITVKHTFFIFLAFAIENLSLMNDTFELFIVLN